MARSTRRRPVVLRNGQVICTSCRKPFAREEHFARCLKCRQAEAQRLLRIREEKERCEEGDKAAMIRLGIEWNNPDVPPRLCHGERCLKILSNDKVELYCPKHYKAKYGKNVNGKSAAKAAKNGNRHGLKQRVCISKGCQQVIPEYSLHQRCDVHYREHRERAENKKRIVAEMKRQHASKIGVEKGQELRLSTENPIAQANEDELSSSSDETRSRVTSGTSFRTVSTSSTVNTDISDNLHNKQDKSRKFIPDAHTEDIQLRRSTRLSTGNGSIKGSGVRVGYANESRSTSPDSDNLMEDGISETSSSAVVDPLLQGDIDDNYSPDQDLFESNARPNTGTSGQSLRVSFPPQSSSKIPDNPQHRHANVNDLVHYSPSEHNATIHFQPSRGTHSTMSTHAPSPSPQMSLGDLGFDNMAPAPSHESMGRMNPTRYHPYRNFSHPQMHVHGNVPPQAHLHHRSISAVYGPPGREPSGAYMLHHPPYRHLYSNEHSEYPALWPQSQHTGPYRRGDLYQYRQTHPYSHSHFASPPDSVHLHRPYHYQTDVPRPRLPSLDHIPSFSKLPQIESEVTQDDYRYNVLEPRPEAVYRPRTIAVMNEQTNEHVGATSIRMEESQELTRAEVNPASPENPRRESQTQGSPLQHLVAAIDLGRKSPLSNHAILLSSPRPSASYSLLPEARQPNGRRIETMPASSKSKLPLMRDSLVLPPLPPEPLRKSRTAPTLFSYVNYTKNQESWFREDTTMRTNVRPRSECVM